MKEREAALTDRNDGDRELVETPGRGKPTAMERLVKTYGDRTYRRPGQSAEIPLEDVLPPFHEDGRHAGGILDWSASVDEASRVRNCDACSSRLDVSTRHSALCRSRQHPDPECPSGVRRCRRRIAERRLEHRVDARHRGASHSAHSLILLAQPLQPLCVRRAHSAVERVLRRLRGNVISGGGGGTYALVWATGASQRFEVKVSKEMDGWWTEIEDEILSWLERDGESTPSELGRHLGLSTGATMSLLAILASDGKVSITRVAVNRASGAAPAPVETETALAPPPARRRRPPMPAPSPHA